MDSADQAAAVAELDRRVALSRRAPAPARTGRCLWCDAPCPGAYCDADCRADHARHAAAQGVRVGVGAGRGGR